MPRSTHRPDRQASHEPRMDPRKPLLPILLAVLAVNSVGGLAAMTEKSAAHFGSADAAFSVLPPVDQAALPEPLLAVAAA